MARTARRRTGRQQFIEWGITPFFVLYTLSLCTINPRIHADTLRGSSPSQHASPDHCKRPPSATFPSPLTADHGTTPEPLCCEFRGGQNKALSSAFAHTDFLPLLVRFLLPFEATSVVAGAPSLHEIYALHSSRPPPLYLVHAAFLI